MAIQYTGLPFHQSSFSFSSGRGWRAETLYRAVKDQKLKPFRLPFKHIDIGVLPFKIGDLEDFVNHLIRVNLTDLSIPVLLEERGYIVDGWHRVARAISEGRRWVLAYRLKENPPFDFTE